MRSGEDPRSNNIYLTVHCASVNYNGGTIRMNSSYMMGHMLWSKSSSILHFLMLNNIHIIFIPTAHWYAIQLNVKSFYIKKLSLLKNLDGGGEGQHKPWGLSIPTMERNYMYRKRNRFQETDSLSDKPVQFVRSLPRLDKWRVRSGVEFGEITADQWGKGTGTQDILWVPKEDSE